MAERTDGQPRHVQIQKPSQRSRRPRAARACNACQSKKYRCDELNPCSYCKGLSLLRGQALFYILKHLPVTQDTISHASTRAKAKSLMAVD